MHSVGNPAPARPEAVVFCGMQGSGKTDNTNPSRGERAVYVRPAVGSGFRVLAFWHEALPREALARNARREGRERIPVPGVLGTYKRLQVPSLDEGFDAVFRVRSKDGHRFVVEPLDTHGARVGQERR